MGRKSFNEIIPGKLYQRGQILTWQYEDKKKLLDHLGIDIIVNFWPKVDSDLAPYWYFYIPNNRSDMMLDEEIDLMALTIADLLESKTVLVLCEAGKTRSVFFLTLVMSYWHDVTLRDALDIVEKAVPKHSLKKFMLEYIDQSR